MPIGVNPPWRALETWSARAFFIAGGAWAIDAILNVSELVVDITIPGAVFGVLILAALISKMVGVLGFYRPIADRSGRLAIAGAIPIVIAGILALVTVVWVAVAGLMNQSLPPGDFLVVDVVLIVLGLLLFGVASIRTDAPSRMCGVLVLALVATFLVWLAGVGRLYAFPDWSSAAFGTVLSVLSLAVGYVRQTSPTPTEYGEQPSDIAT